MSELKEHIRIIPHLPHWMVLTTFVSVGVLFYIYLHSPNLIVMPVRALVDKRVRRQLIESGNSFQRRIFNLLDVVFYISLSFILYALIKEKNNEKEGFLNWYDFRTSDELLLFSGILIGVLIVVFIKRGIFEAVIYLFDEKHKYSFFLFNWNMFLKSIGLFLFLSVFLYYWGIFPSSRYLDTAFITLMMAYLLFLIASFIQIPHKSFIDYLNFILYLCALEIIPVLFILKFLFFKNG